MSRISVAAARVNTDMTQEEMANALGITRQTYAAWESGKSKMTAEGFMLFCEVTGFSPNDIILPSESTKSVRV